MLAGDLQEPAYRFLNRLSDYLFTAARHVAYTQGIPETKYQPRKQPATEAGRPE